MGAADEQAVEGLNAVAYWKAASAQLYVCTSDKFLTITQYKPPAVSDDEARERAQRIAKRVLENI
ncbi:MAG: hypothetical protein GY750_17875 [Lentisphaerae bacterium]|nr:hypothetical protein [Lentisphaerota bacterium]